MAHHEAEKVQIAHRKNDYFGPFNHHQRLSNAEKTRNANESPMPSTIIQKIFSFFVPGSVFRRFVSNIARIAAPLHDKLSDDQPEHFGAITPKKMSAMHELQGGLVYQPKLALPSNSGMNTSYTDLCNAYVGCVLLQEKPDRTFKPDRFSSWLLTKAY